MIPQFSSILSQIANQTKIKVASYPKICSISIFPQNLTKLPHSSSPQLTSSFCVFLYAAAKVFPMLNSCLRGRNIILQMQVQTLVLPLIQKPAPQTLIAIIQEFSPKGLALREDRLLVLLDDPQTCAQLVLKVKGGAYPELKREVFEILDSAANTNALLENGTGFFETAEQVRHFFQLPPQNTHSKQEPLIHEEEVKAKLDSVVEEPMRIDLLESLYEPSGKIEVDFAQSVFQSMDSPAPEAMGKEMERSEEFVSAFSHEVVLEEEKETFADIVTNTLEQSTEIRLQTDNRVHQQKETAERAYIVTPPICPNPPIATSPSSSPTNSHSPTSAYLTAILLLWICWLAI